MNPIYKRVIIKVSGEALATDDGSAIFDREKLLKLSEIIKSLRNEGVEIGLVVGAGNIWRGRLAASIGLDLERADYMGMTGTIINAMALENCLKNQGVDAVCLSALPYEKVVETYSPELAKKYLSEGKVVVFGAGTGKPFCTTDSCASLRCRDIEADAILMGKHGVDGVYDSDPSKNPNAKFIKTLTFKEIIEKKLGVIDTSAAEMLVGSKVVVRIFNIADLNNFIKVVHGDDIGSFLQD